MSRKERWPAALVALLAALAAYQSRLFTYHSAYDDVLIAFLLIALSVRAFGREGTMGWKAGWLLCGLTLWLPYRLYIPVTAQMLQVSCWMLLAGALILFPDRSARRHTY